MELLFYYLWLHLLLCDFCGFTNFYHCFNEFLDCTNTFLFVFIVGILDLHSVHALLHHVPSLFVLLFKIPLHDFSKYGLANSSMPFTYLTTSPKKIMNCFPSSHFDDNSDAKGEWHNVIDWSSNLFFQLHL